MEMNYLLLGIIIGLFVTFVVIEIKQNCFISNSAKRVKRNIIEKLSRQAARWSTAADQDKTPMIAVLHATYGAGYLWALKDIASNREIEEVTGIKTDKFEKEITDILDKKTKEMIKLCPEYGPEKSLLSFIGGENI